jgi:hypothetical protein
LELCTHQRSFYTLPFLIFHDNEPKLLQSPAHGIFDDSETSFKETVISNSFKLKSVLINWTESEYHTYRAIQEQLQTLMELISHDILSKKCHINLGPILNIYKVTFIFGIFSKFQF